MSVGYYFCIWCFVCAIAGRGQTRTVTKTVPNESFFTFFDPPEGESIRSTLSANKAQIVYVQYVTGTDLGLVMVWQMAAPSH